MKVRINPWRLIWRFLIILLVIYIVLFLAGISLFVDFSTGTLRQWDFRQPLFIGLIFVISVISFLPSLISSYYIIENKYFLFKKYNKEITYNYANVEFIDEEQSAKKKKVIFYVKGPGMIYLLADKNNVLLETMLKKCTNRVSKERFYASHPEER